MADTALHLVGQVIPEVPVRQWVCSLPWRLRVLLGYDRRLCADVLEAFVVELSRSYKRRAKASLSLQTVDDALAGAVSVIQRGDSALRLNVHFHVLALDGAYVRPPDGGAPVFHALAAPSAEEITDVATRTARRVEKILTRHGRTLDGTGEQDAEEPLGEQLALAALCAAAADGRGITGDRAGEPLLRVVNPARARRPELVGESGGINVHAEVAVPARDRAQLERLCRYLCRPPIAQERLEETASGKLRYGLKKPWRDGTLAIVFEPMDLLARVCALIPPPRFHMVRYHGVLSSHAKVRAEIVPHVEELPVQLPLFKQERIAERDLDVLAPEPRRKPWAWLLRHVFTPRLRRSVDLRGLRPAGLDSVHSGSRSTSRPAHGAAAPPAGSRPRPRPTPSRACSRSTASARGRHPPGRRPRGSCASRSPARDRGERRSEGRPSGGAHRGGATSEGGALGPSEPPGGLGRRTARPSGPAKAVLPPLEGVRSRPEPDSPGVQTRLDRLSLVGNPYPPASPGVQTRLDRLSLVGNPYPQPDSPGVQTRLDRLSLVGVPYPPDPPRCLDEGIRAEPWPHDRRAAYQGRTKEPGQ
jgi:hypothetical protein